eukprot:Nk52_evm23s2579 gene=Nk52_evmTU23s2579
MSANKSLVASMATLMGVMLLLLAVSGAHGKSVDTNSDVSKSHHRHCYLFPCPAKQYCAWRFFSAVCEDCSANCVDCSCKTNCNKCDSAHVLFDKKCDKTACPDGYYKDSKNVCQKCDAGCAKCTGKGQCTACTNDLILEDGKCVKSCPEGTFHDMQSNSCKSCSAQDSHCTACTDVKQCTACSGDYFPYMGECVDKCPSGTYKDGKDCKSCSAQDSHCTACTDVKQCTACSGDYFPYMGECVDKCPSGTYKDGKDCKSCSAQDSHCTACTDVKQCTACSGDYFPYMGECVDKCPPGLYEVEGKCIKEDSVKVENWGGYVVSAKAYRNHKEISHTGNFPIRQSGTIKNVHIGDVIVADITGGKEVEFTVQHSNNGKQMVVKMRGTTADPSYEYPKDNMSAKLCGWKCSI